MAKVTHKSKRVNNYKDQERLCAPGKSEKYAENLKHNWNNPDGTKKVTCKKCRRLGGK